MVDSVSDTEWETGMLDNRTGFPSGVGALSPIAPSFPIIHEKNRGCTDLGLFQTIKYPFQMEKPKPFMNGFGWAEGGSYGHTIFHRRDDK
jgi:hypothetical protein